VDGDDDDEEEEEEEEDGGVVMEDQRHGHYHRGGIIGRQLRPPTPVHSARTSPTSSAAPRTPREVAASGTPPQYTTSPSPMSVAGNKVKVVKQWTPRTEIWAATG
jgi:casein kinase II subunit beta